MDNEKCIEKEESAPSESDWPLRLFALFSQKIQKYPTLLRVKITKTNPEESRAREPIRGPGDAPPHFPRSGTYGINHRATSCGSRSIR